MSYQNKKIDVNKILSYYSIRNVSEYGPEINFSCPFPEHHRGDQRPSSYINSETYQYNCFGCNREGSIVTFVAAMEDVSYEEAERLISMDFVDEYLENNSLQQYLKKVIQPKDVEKPRKLSENTLSLFSVNWERAFYAYYKYNKLPKKLSVLFDRKFSFVSLNYYHIGFDLRSKRITIPCRDEQGNLVGFKGRATERHQTPKYLNIGDREGSKTYYGFGPYKVGDYVWGIDSADENVIIVEGELDAIWLRQNGFNSVSIGGSNPTERQIEIIKNNCNSTVLLLDDDEAGAKAERKLKISLLDSIPVKIASCLPGKDPAEMTQIQIREQIKQAKNALI